VDAAGRDDIDDLVRLCGGERLARAPPLPIAADGGALSDLPAIATRATRDHDRRGHAQRFTRRPSRRAYAFTDHDAQDLRAVFSARPHRACSGATCAYGGGAWLKRFPRVARGCSPR
jgi:hypothetical protein